MAMSEDEAVLRVALLAATADGDLLPAELRAIAHALRRPEDSLSDDAFAQALRLAAADVAARPAADVLADARLALPTSAARRRALSAAVDVAGADHRLAWTETSRLSMLAQGLGLGPRDIQRAVRAAGR